jgi:hypothetical protein
MPRDPKENKRKTEFKSPNIGIWKYFFREYTSSLLFVLALTIILILTFVAKDKDKLFDIFSKALFVILGYIAGLKSKK